VPTYFRLAVSARVALLPLALVLGTVAGLGSYCETSDEISFAWLFSGVLALKPVPSVPLYFHGWGHSLAALYTVAPTVPWVGVLVGGLLGTATVLTFAVLDKLLRPHLRPWALGLVLVAFFAAAWLEHWLWFSTVRAALLLAGGALLFAAQRPGRLGPLLVGLSGLGAAWLMRPSLAVLAFGATLPAVLLLAGHWRRAAPLVASAAAGLVLAAGVLSWHRTPDQVHTQTRDGYFARILDFDQVRPRPRTPADSLGTNGISIWLLGDSTLINEALCRRAYAFDAADFFGREVPAKLRQRTILLVRDYFPMVLALLATGAGVFIQKRRRLGFWLVQISFVGVLVLFAGLLKLPPRLELPLLDFWLLTNLVFLLKVNSTTSHAVPHADPLATASALFALSFRRAGMAAALLVLLLYGAKTRHRRQVLGQEQRCHERALAEISRRTSGHPRVLAGGHDLLKSLSPFRVYGLGIGPTLLLSGWPAHDRSQPALRRGLTGAADQTECLRRLAEPARGARWVLSTETARWLNRRFRFGAGTGPVVGLRPRAALAADTSLRFYEPFVR